MTPPPERPLRKQHPRPDRLLPAELVPPGPSGAAPPPPRARVPCERTCSGVAAAILPRRRRCRRCARAAGAPWCRSASRAAAARAHRRYPAASPGGRGPASLPGGAPLPPVTLPWHRRRRAGHRVTTAAVKTLGRGPAQKRGTGLVVPSLLHLSRPRSVPGRTRSQRSTPGNELTSRHG